MPKNLAKMHTHNVRILEAYYINSQPNIAIYEYYNEIIIDDDGHCYKEYITIYSIQIMSIASISSCPICSENFFSSSYPKNYDGYCSFECKNIGKEKLEMEESIDTLKEKMDTLEKKMDILEKKIIYCSDTINALIDALAGQNN